MSSSGTMARPERYTLKPRLVEVVDVERVTPSYVRITVGGPDLEGFRTGSPTDHVKLVFPGTGSDTPTMPTVADGGRMAFPEDRSNTVLRDYTPVRFDPGQGTVAFEFVLHGSGPASDWAEKAKIGDRLGILGPRGSFALPTGLDWMMVIGDETVIPLLSRTLVEMPASTRVSALMEVNGAEDEQDIGVDSAAIQWVHRAGKSAATPLLDTLTGMEIPDGNGRFHVAGETSAVIAVRRYLVNERGVPKERVAFEGHWKAGVADWDHHEPLEVDD